MARDPKHWGDLQRTQRWAITAVGVLDVGLRVWALIDLARRPQDQVRGPKPAWALALSVVNSAGILPGAYFAWGRRTD